MFSFLIAQMITFFFFFLNNPPPPELSPLPLPAALPIPTQLTETAARPRRADRVLVDAPCSELGTLRRGPDARWRIDPGLLAALPLLQRELLETAAPKIGRAHV